MSDDCHSVEGLAGVTGVLFVVSEVLALSGCNYNGVVDAVRHFIARLRSPPLSDVPVVGEHQVQIVNRQ